MAVAMYSQTPPRSGSAAIETPVNALRSPEVNADRTVTLRFRAPEATAVDVVGEVTMGKGPQPMTRAADGVWTAAVGPLAPEIWSYNFRMQGIDIPDPSNPAIKPVPPGLPIASLVEVPGAQFMDADAVFRDALANPAGINKKLRLLWLSCGRQDFLYEANRRFAESLKSKGVAVTVREMEGAHVWSVWRNNLNESAALLFK
jgi:hypothetical protein